MFHRPRSESENMTASEGDSGKKESNNANEQVKNTVQTKVADKPAAVSSSSSSSANVSVNSKTKESPMNKDDKEKNTPSRPLDIPGQSGYQPPSGAQAPRIPGSYNPGGYAGTNNGQKNAERSSGANLSGEGRRLLIGPGITMSGEIESCDYLVVEGTVEAALKGASVLEITETGTFYGTVEIDEATVAGQFEGDITVNGRLTITETGSITGTIAYKELAIEAGAKLDGKVSPLAGKAAAKSEKTEKTESAPKTKEARGKTEAASPNDNSDSEELPFEATAAAAE